MEENKQPEINTEMASEEVSAVGEAPEEKVRDKEACK